MCRHSAQCGAEAREIIGEKRAAESHHYCGHLPAAGATAAGSACRRWRGRRGRLQPQRARQPADRGAGGGITPSIDQGTETVQATRAMRCLWESAGCTSSSRRRGPQAPRGEHCDTTCVGVGHTLCTNGVGSTAAQWQPAGCDPIGRSQPEGGQLVRPLPLRQLRRAGGAAHDLRQRRWRAQGITGDRNLSSSCAATWGCQPSWVGTCTHL